MYQHFLWGGLASPDKDNSHQTGQFISITVTANLNAPAAEKENIGEITVEPLTKAKKKKMKVKSKVAIFSTEKPCKFCSNTCSKISVKARLRQ